MREIRKKEVDNQRIKNGIDDWDNRNILQKIVSFKSNGTGSPNVAGMRECGEVDK